MKKSSIIKKLPLKEANVVLLKVPFEGTISGGAGTARGPRAICDMLDYQVEEWDCLLKRNTGEGVGIIEKNIETSKLNPKKVIGRVEKETILSLRRKKFPIIIGGEHSISLGAISAAKKIFDSVTIVQIDAHADLRDDNSDYEGNFKKITKYAHSCVMRRVYEMGCPILQVGIRSMSPMEYNFVKKNKLEKNIFYAPVKASYKKIISRCPTKKVYLTIDVDGFNPSVMPATGTPEPGGLSWDWTLGFFRELFSRKEIIGFDIVEVVPRRGEFRTEFAAAKLLYHLIGLKFLKNR